MAEDILIKKSDLDENGYYKEDGLDVDVNIKSEINLGTIKCIIYAPMIVNNTSMIATLKSRIL